MLGIIDLKRKRVLGMIGPRRLESVGKAFAGVGKKLAENFRRSPAGTLLGEGLESTAALAVGQGSKPFRSELLPSLREVAENARGVYDPFPEARLEMVDGKPKMVLGQYSRSFSPMMADLKDVSTPLDKFKNQAHTPEAAGVGGKKLITGALINEPFNDVLSPIQTRRLPSTAKGGIGWVLPDGRFIVTQEPWIGGEHAVLIQNAITKKYPKEIAEEILANPDNYGDLVEKAMKEGLGRIYFGNDEVTAQFFGQPTKNQIDAIKMIRDGRKLISENL